jgi:hypothetical protein
MSLPLQIVLGLALATLTVFLVLLLIQARRTAAAMERLAESAIRDLGKVAEDIRQVRSRVDEVADLVNRALELPSTLTQVVTGIIGGLPLLLGRRTGASNWVDSLLTGIESALHLFRRPKAAHPEEAPHA